MKIHSVTPTSFQSGVRIRGAENKAHKYLYNELLGITKEYRVPANFRTQEIELPNVSEAILKKLNELGIKFSNK